MQDGADAVKSTSVDGMTIGTPLEALTDGRDAMLAVGDERRAAARSSTASRSAWSCPACTATCRPPSGWSTSRSPGSPTSRPTGPTAASREKAPIKTAVRIDVPRSFARVQRRRGRRRRRRLGPAPRHREGRGPGRRRGLAGRRPRRPRTASTPGGSGVGRGPPPAPAITGCRSARPMRTATPRTPDGRRLRPTGQPAGTA